MKRLLALVFILMVGSCAISCKNEAVVCGRKCIDMYKKYEVDCQFASSPKECNVIRVNMFGDCYFNCKDMAVIK